MAKAVSIHLTLQYNTDISNAVAVKNVEKVNVTSYGAHSIDMKYFSGVDTLASIESTGQITLTNVASSSMGLKLKGVNQSINATYSDLSGTSDILKVTLEDTQNAAVTVNAGFESAEITANGASNEVDTFNAAGVNTLTIKGDSSVTFDRTQDPIQSIQNIIIKDAKAINLANLSDVKTLTASDNTDGISTGIDTGTDGFVDSDKITANSNGATVTLGSGDDNIVFNDSANSGKTNTLILGAGNDKLTFEKGSGNNTILAKEGDDQILISDTNTAISNSADYFDMGDGDDTIIVNNNESNNFVLKDVENLTLKNSATGTNTISSANKALKVTAEVGNGTTATGPVDVQGLTAGSTVTINNAKDATGGVNDIKVGFASTEAATTIDVNAKVTSAGTGITVSKVTDLTLDFADAVDLTNATDDLTIDDTKKLTINASKALDLGTGISNVTAGDKLEEIKVTGSDAVDMGKILNSDKLKTVNITATKDLTIDDFKDVRALTDLTLEGKSVTVGTTSTQAAIGTNTAADALNSVSITATNGDVKLQSSTNNDKLINAKELGTVTISADKGSIYGNDQTVSSTDGAYLVYAQDENGITVNLSAKSNIKAFDGTNSGALVVENTKGNVTATLSGDAAANIVYNTGTATGATGAVSLNASNLKGGLTAVVSNTDSDSITTSSSISLGAKDANTQNTVTVAGTVDTLTVNGSGGKDTITLGTSSTTDKFQTATISLGAGADTLDVSNLDPYATDSDSDDGVAANFGSSSHTFTETDSANNTSVAANTVVQYDHDAAKKVVADGFKITTSGVDKFVGTDNNDYIIANSTGMTIDGGAGNDIIEGGAGNDVIRGGAGIDNISAGNGDDIIVVVGSGGSYTSDPAAGTGAAKLGLTQSDLNSGNDDGSGETYDGGAGSNDILEIWGNVDTTNDSLSNIEHIYTNSTLTINATQLNTLATQAGGTVNVDLLDNNSTIILADIDQLSNTQITNLLNVLNQTDFDFNGTTAVIRTDQMNFDVNLDSNVDADDYFSMTSGELGTTGADTIDASSATVGKLIWGGGNDDILTGGTVSDLIVGGSGNDTIKGGIGNDIIMGNTGSDTIKYDSASELGDILLDFTAGSLANGGDILSFASAMAKVGDFNTIEEIAGAAALGAGAGNDGDVIVVTGGDTNSINTSGGALVAINSTFAAGGNEIATNAEMLLIFNDDTDGDGTADQVSIYYATSNGDADNDFESAALVGTVAATTSGPLAATADLQGVFVDDNFAIH